MCKLFGCLPSQLATEDFEQLMKLYSLENALKEYESWQYDDKIPTRLKLRMEIMKLERRLDNAKS